MATFRREEIANLVNLLRMAIHGRPSAEKGRTVYGLDSRLYVLPLNDVVARFNTHALERNMRAGGQAAQELRQSTLQSMMDGRNRFNVPPEFFSTMADVFDEYLERNKKHTLPLHIAIDERHAQDMQEAIAQLRTFAQDRCADPPPENAGNPGDDLPGKTIEERIAALRNERATSRRR